MGLKLTTDQSQVIALPLPHPFLVGNKNTHTKTLKHILGFSVLYFLSIQIKINPFSPYSSFKLVIVRESQARLGNLFMHGFTSFNFSTLYSVFNILKLHCYEQLETT